MSIVQKSDLDNFIVERIKSGRFIVNPETGKVFGSMLNADGRRKEIGSISKHAKKATIGLTVEGKSRSFDVSRMVWLAVHKHIIEGLRVVLIDGDATNTKISNLKLIEETKYFKSWTEEEINFLKENKDSLTWKEISEKLNRSIKSVRGKAKSLSVKKEIKRKLWTEEEDLLVESMLKKGFPIKDIAEKLGRTFTSISMRARKFEYEPQSRHLIRPLNHNNFYGALKSAKIRGSAVLYCCICQKEYKYCTIHHIDENHKNNHISNQATLCPNHHAEVHGGEHNGVKLYAIWQRVFSDGEKSKIKTNLDLL